MHRRQLTAQLGDYVPDPSEASDVVERFHELLALSGDVFSRHHFVPGHVTASALVVSADRRRIVLVRHRKLERWLQPGGHVEPGDVDLVAAAEREVVEECGPLHLRSFGLIDLDIHPIPALGGEPGHLHYDVRIGFEGLGNLAASDEVEDARWFELEAVPTDADDSVRRLLGKVALIG